MNATELPVALFAGFLSFLAPCVLPLVPGYLSAVSAVEADRLGERGSARRVVLASIPFVLGFTAVFVLLGVGAQLVGGSLLRDQFLLERIAGFVLVVFGFAFMGLLPWPERLLGAGLLQEARSRGSRLALGGTFAICAAPCIGPVLAAILVLAGSSDTVLQGALLLAVYSLGLAIPFVLAGAIFTRAMGAFRLAARPLHRHPVRQRRHHGRARPAALLRALLHPPYLPQPLPRVDRNRACFLVGKRSFASRSFGNPLARVSAARRIPETGNVRFLRALPLLQADFRWRGSSETRWRGFPPREDP